MPLICAKMLLHGVAFQAMPLFLGAVQKCLQHIIDVVQDMYASYFAQLL